MLAKAECVTRPSLSEVFSYNILRYVVQIKAWIESVMLFLHYFHFNNQDRLVVALQSRPYESNVNDTADR